MVEVKDITLLFGAVLFLSGTVLATGIVQPQKVLDSFNPGGVDTNPEPEKTSYKLTTSITLEGETNDILIKESSFSYDTAECSLFTCNQLAFSDLSVLALGGVNQAELTTTIYNRSSGQKFAEVNKFIGEVGIGQTETFTRTFSPVPSGEYRVQYKVTANSDVFGIPVERKISKNIRVPETVAG